MPRYLVEKDQSLINALIHNYLETPVQANVSLTAEGVELLDKEKDVIDIEPSGRGIVNWKVKTEKAGNAQFTVKALTKIYFKLLNPTIKAKRNYNDKNN